jgi:hypothetical protein
MAKAKAKTGAKGKAKTKAKAEAARPKKNGDPLAVSLGLLAHADRQSLRALRLLFRAILEPIREPAFADCEFDYGGEHYDYTLTEDQCEQILAAVKNGDDVPAVVERLLVAMTKQIADDIDLLETTMGGPASSPEGTTGDVLLVKVVQLGCCIVTGTNSIPNLTQSQCNQYNPIKWDSGNANCTQVGE